MSFGRYRIVEKLGSGGFGEVYRGLALGAQGFAKPVVIKQIHRRRAEDQEMLQAFINEAKLCMNLSHRNIVQVHNLGMMDDQYFIVMEYVRGKDLRQVLGECESYRRWPSKPLALHIVVEVLRALDYAQRLVDDDGNPLGIIHRDVTPANILCSFEGDIKLTDFGLARSRLWGTVPGLFRAGTCRYMSPEQATGAYMDRRSDVFSAGILLYLLVCGRHPFDGADDKTILERVIREPLAPPSRHDPKIGAELEAVITHALNKRPADRFSDAGEMLAALERLHRASPALPSDMRALMLELFPAQLSRPQAALDPKETLDWEIQPGLDDDPTETGISVFTRISARPAGLADSPGEGENEGWIDADATTYTGDDDSFSSLDRGDLRLDRAHGVALGETQAAMQAAPELAPIAPTPSVDLDPDQETIALPSRERSSTDRFGDDDDDAVPKPPRNPLALLLTAAVVLAAAGGLSFAFLGHARSGATVSGKMASTPASRRRASRPRLAATSSQVATSPSERGSPSGGSTSRHEADASTPPPSKTTATRRRRGAHHHVRTRPRWPATHRRRHPVAAAAERVQPPTEKKGWLRVSTRPAYAEVHVGGRRLDDTPCRIALPVGSHVVRLINPELRRSITRRVTIHENRESAISISNFK